MEKGKRILALVGAILLVGLYIFALIAGLTSSPDTVNILMAALFCTIVLPVLIWAYTFIYKLVHKKEEE